MKIAIIGKGRVGTALAPTLMRTGNDVVFGVRDPNESRYANSETPVRSTGEAVAWAEIVIAAIMWEAVDDFLLQAGDMTNKILIDCINPYDFTDGLRRLISGDTSTASIIQSRTSAAVVKTLNQVGSPVMADPSAYGLKPLQFVAADNVAAKAMVVRLLSGIGFDARDAGDLSHAVDLESMARLWIAQTFVQGMAAETSWALVGRAGS